MTKTVGFLDLFLDHWHALAIARHLYGGEFRLSHAYGRHDKPGGLTNQQWCEKFGVTLCASPEEVIEKSDYLLVLAPSNPEVHEELAEAALRAGKPLFIDKTMAPDEAAAARMFDLAERHATPMFSSSALRFAPELASLKEALQGKRATRISVGCAGSVEEYSVHALEMLIAVAEERPTRVRQANRGPQPLFVLEFPGGIEGVVELFPRSPFRLSAVAEDGTAVHHPQMPVSFFGCFADAVLQFFQAGRSPVCRWQTEAIVASVAACIQAAKHPGEWINLPGGGEPGGAA